MAQTPEKSRTQAGALEMKPTQYKPVKNALLDLTIYQSSYMTDFQPYGNYGYIRMEPGEKEKLDRQLREKELYRPVVSPIPKLSAGYTAFGRTHLTARNLGRPCFFLLPQAGPAQEAAQGEPEEEILEEDACRVAGTCPCMYPRSYGLSLARVRLDSPLYQVANLPCLLEPERQPAPHIGTGYFLMPGCLCAFHHKIKYPILSRWGPLLPFYQ
ncbi:testis-expressed sequence 37 protein [Sorex araneus]|uniref:testis-expressed sequence 37 protein n=1 Tax=Sorex araneus TaxID=42254 RepID=UPI002433DAE9|nr:testis-expressed sequence 37 protein [Sorex araneus]